MNPLEYEEYEEEDSDDLFGPNGNLNDHSDNHSSPFSNINTSRPIMPNMASSSSEPGPSTSRNKMSQSNSTVAVPSELRLAELQSLKYGDPEMRIKGVMSLKVSAMKVIRANSDRIWDIGTASYETFKPFIDDLPMAQLEAIEENTPDIRKDTDWLWEIFLLQEFPRIHSQVRIRKGELRTHGWRRMYKTAKKESEERREAAMTKAAAAYKKLADEKESKKIVFMDHVPSPKKPNKRGGKGPATLPTPRNASISRAKQDIAKARIAMTHASGRIVAPPPKTLAQRENQQFRLYPPSAIDSVRNGQTNGRASPVGMANRIPPPKMVRKEYQSPSGIPAPKPKAISSANPNSKEVKRGMMSFFGPSHSTFTEPKIAPISASQKRPGEEMANDKDKSAKTSLNGGFPKAMPSKPKPPPSLFMPKKARVTGR